MRLRGVERNVNAYLKEFSRRQVALELFTITKLEITPDEIIAFGKGKKEADIEFRAITDNRLEFEKAIGFLKTGFSELAFKNQSFSNHKHNFDRLVESVSEGFFALAELRSKELPPTLTTPANSATSVIKAERLADDEINLTSGDKLTLALNQLTSFMKEKLKLTENELSALGQGRDIKIQIKPSKNLTALVHNQSRFFSRMRFLENGFENLKQTVHFSKQEEDEFGKLLEGTKAAFRDRWKQNRMYESGQGQPVQI